MRIGVDAHILTDKFQGSRTYLLNLLRRLPAIDRENEYFIYSGDPDAARDLIGVEDRYEYRRLASHGPVGRLLLEFPRQEKRDRLDLLYHQYIAPPFARCRTAVTIHDILFESHPQFFSKLFVARSRWLVRRSAKRAAAVFTDSQYSRQEILRRYGLPAEKIHITYCAVDLDRYRPLQAEELQPRGNVYREHRPFLLYVGRIDPRKNLLGILEALALRRQRGTLNETLLVTGHKDYRFREVFEAIERHGLGDCVVFLGGVPDEDLPVLYNMAEAFVFPSWAEGFGLPVLEAMACGTPVVTTDRGSLAEVAGDAAVIADPASAESIAEGIDRLQGDTQFRTTLREKGLRQARRFDWESSARTFHKAIQSIGM